MTKKAFTLVECLITLIIMSLIALLLSLQIRVIKETTIRSLNKPLDWYICLTELESQDHQFVLDKVSPSKLRLVSHSTGITYDLYGTDRLYLSRVNRGGYMLLFADIKPGTVAFNELAGARVKIQAERKNGQNLIGVVKFYEKTTKKKSSGICPVN